MFRARTLVIIVLVAWLIYALSPAERKSRIRDKIRHVWVSLALSVIAYWIYMISLAVWKYWRGDQ